MTAPVTLTDDEIIALTGYRQRSRQLAELRRQGYWRARQAPVTGAVIVERAHYEAVSRGADLAPSGKPYRRAA